MSKLIQATGAALLATASLAAQADTFTFSSELDNLSGFTNTGVTTSLFKGTTDSFALLNSTTDTLTYSFTLASASDVTISFWYGSDKSGGKSGANDAKATVSWLDGITPVTLAGGSSSLNLVAPNIGNVAPSPLGTQATYSGTGLAAGSYTFSIAATTNNNFRVDTFSVSSVSAVPEPETFAMMAVGLGAVGFMSRRRKVK